MILEDIGRTAATWQACHQGWRSKSGRSKTPGDLPTVHVLCDYGYKRVQPDLKPVNEPVTSPLYVSIAFLSH